MEDRTRKMGVRKRKRAGAAALFLVTVLWLAAAPLTASAAGMGVGDSVPSLSLRAAEGGVYDLRAELETGPVLLAFVSPKCTPCRESRPVLDRVARAYGPACGLSIVSVLLGYGPASSDPELPTSERLLQGDEAMAQAYGVFGTPVFYLVGRNGTVLWKHVGRLVAGPAERALDDAIDAELAATALAR
ncbi:MAG: TlpA family protein disulfide reductase [Deltaproteobacteria bacterium]|nr:TlpA family protein disulfide reductase [Deltaproteobacteria bacterium]